MTPVRNVPCYQQIAIGPTNKIEMTKTRIFDIFEQKILKILNGQ